MNRNSIVLALVLVLTWSSAHAAIFSANSPLNITSIQVLNNTTAIVISANPATLYAIEVANNSATIAYIKVYKQRPPPVAPARRKPVYDPASTIANLGNANGDAYGAGITMCVTTGYADTDTGSPAANAYIVDVHYKRSNL